MSRQPEILPTAERVRELFEYDDEVGALRWRISQSSRAKVGAVAGNIRKDGRRCVCVDGVQYLAYRVIWLHHKGTWPNDEIDHWDTDHTNDRIGNLRDVTGAVNAENKRHPRSDKRFGTLLGAYPSGARWRAQIGVDRKVKHLGSFDTEQQAHAAYLNAKRELHDGCTI